MEDFDLDRAALLLLDFQNYGIHPDGYWAKHGEPDWPAVARPAMENASRALAAARKAGLLVIHVGVAWREGSPEANLSAPLFSGAPDRSVEGTWGAQFCELVKPLAGEVVIYKRGVSALAGTELDRLFRVRDVRTLVLSGVATQFAVEGTARDAVDRGYRVVVLEDCCASRERAVQEFSIERILRHLCEVTTAERLISELDAAAKLRDEAAVGHSGGDAQGNG
jgi:nicotinamidase-related amidase